MTSLAPGAVIFEDITLTFQENMTTLSKFILRAARGACARAPPGSRHIGFALCPAFPRSVTVCLQALVGTNSSACTLGPCEQSSDHCGYAANGTAVLPSVCEKLDRVCDDCERLAPVNVQTHTTRARRSSGQHCTVSNWHSDEEEAQGTLLPQTTPFSPTPTTSGTQASRVVEMADDMTAGACKRACLCVCA